MELRDYQQEMVDAIWRDMFRSSKTLCVAATGAGKTLVFIALIKKCIELKPDIRIIVLLNRVSLARQTYVRMIKDIDPRSVGLYCSTLKARDLSRTVTVASVNSIAKIKTISCNLLILDEVHRCQEHDGYYGEVLKTLNENPRMKLVGFTATPFTSRGYIYGPGKMFDCISYQIGIKKLIEKGYLVPPRMKALKEEFSTDGFRVQCGDWSPSDLTRISFDIDKAKAQTTEALALTQDRRSILWACINIDHAEMISKMVGGRTIHSKMSQRGQESTLEAFKRGEFRHLVFVTIVSEGIDIPRADALVVLRPTRSPVLFVQMFGRVLRIFEGKKDALILDYGQVVANCGTLDNPCVRDSRSKRPEPIKKCPCCQEVMPLKLRECPDCGYVFEVVQESRDKNIYARASDGSLFESEREQKISRVDIDHYVSKAGNECIRINYYTSFFAPPIREYFTWDVLVGRKRLRSRLNEFGLELRGTIKDQILEQPKKYPIAIKYTKRKYIEVKELIWNNEAQNGTSLEKSILVRPTSQPS